MHQGTRVMVWDSRPARWAAGVVAAGLLVIAAGCSGTAESGAKATKNDATGAVAEAATRTLPAAQGLAALPNPTVPAPLPRREPQTVKVSLEAQEIQARVDEGVEYTYWTYNGTVPGPMLRVREGDTVELTLKNSSTSKAPHDIDLHAVTGPGGGAAVTHVNPGESATFTFKALNPGLYVYHCATAPIPLHVGSGMYGLILVEPAEGLPAVDKEFYVMQGDLYLEGERGEKGLHGFDLDQIISERPDYVVFNGSVGSLTGDRALKAKVGEKVRIFFGVGGPNITSSFHVIGEIFDRVHAEGATEPATNVQTTLVPAGGATWVDFGLEVPGTYLLVDHSLGRLAKGAVGQMVVEGPEAAGIFHGTATSGGGH